MMEAKGTISDIIKEQKEFVSMTRESVKSTVGEDNFCMGEFEQVDQHKGPNSDRETKVKEVTPKEAEREVGNLNPGQITVSKLIV